MAKALVTWGGWEGHEPEKVGPMFADWLREAGMEVTLTNSLACFDDAEALKGYDLIVPVWTMSKIEKQQALNACAAVASGVGIAGCHGGMCDAFRENVDWQFMTGAQWVAHPGNDGVRYGIRMVSDDALVAGIADFEAETEQYYLHVDPAVKIHAVTDFPVAEGPHTVNGPVAMPVVYTKGYGAGRVYYNALGHKAQVISEGPAARLMKRGLIWATRRG